MTIQFQYGEPEWRSYTRMGSAYEVEMCVNSSPPRYRHRPVVMMPVGRCGRFDPSSRMGYVESEWRDGLPPDWKS